MLMHQLQPQIQMKDLELQMQENLFPKLDQKPGRQVRFSSKPIWIKLRILKTSCHKKDMCNTFDDTNKNIKNISFSF